VLQGCQSGPTGGSPSSFILGSDLIFLATEQIAYTGRYAVFCSPMGYNARNDEIRDNVTLDARGKRSAVRRQPFGASTQRWCYTLV